jgi:large subunit ribosomal protein L19
MKTLELINKIENQQLKKNIPNLAVGDTVLLGMIIQEGNKQRLQPYEGTILAKNHQGINATINVRKIFQGVSIERIFLIHSPSLQKIEVIRHSKVRRAKLYYLTTRLGKTARLVQRFDKTK